MHCKCGNLIEPGYESTGKCEDCYAIVYDNRGPRAKLGTEKPNPATLRGDQALDLPIADLDFNDDLSDRLFSAHITTARDLVGKNRDDLLAISHVGKAALEEIEDRLHAFGLGLKRQY